MVEKVACPTRAEISILSSRPKPTVLFIILEYYDRVIWGISNKVTLFYKVIQSITLSYS